MKQLRYTALDAKAFVLGGVMLAAVIVLKTLGL